MPKPILTSAHLSTFAFLLLGAAALTVLPTSGDIAFAKNGAGKSSERGGGKSGRGSERSGGGNGRGAVASELKSMNSAHANPNALNNAAPGSMPGKLNIYREAVSAEMTAKDQLEADEAELARLQGLTDEEIAEQFPDGGYDDALADAEDAVEASELGLENAEGAAEDALKTLTGGRLLSQAAMDELHQLLGL